MWTRDSQGAACLGNVRLDDLFGEPRAKKPLGGREPIGTPAYVYDLDAIADEARDLAAGFGGAPHLIAYAVKANTAGPIVRALGRVGCGADVVSGAELAVALACGVSPDAVLFSGVAKSAAEMDAAIGAGERGILAIQVESVEEIARIDARAAALGRIARISIRLNPGVVADTHAHVATGHDQAKFGVARVDLDAAWAALDAPSHVRLVGFSMHIGSQLVRTDEYLTAADTLLAIAAARDEVLVRAGRPALEFVDTGGGFGIDYGAGCPTRPADFARAALERVERAGLAGKRIVVEPGRSLVAPHGVLCASVVMTKRSGPRRWLMIDAGMNDYIRPALYGAPCRIEPLDTTPKASDELYRVVGPVCESTDDFAEHRFAEPLPQRVAIRDAGAYGFTMASEYNGRTLPREVFLSGGEVVAVGEPRGVDAWVAERVGIGR